MYLTVGDTRIHEIEALLLRIARPRGNKVQGKFVRSDDLRRALRRAIRTAWRRDLEDVFTTRPRVARKARSSSTARATPLARYVTKRVRIRFTHKGQVHKASIRGDGTINYRGRIFTSPSGAAKAITRRPTSGWSAWQYQRAPGDWVPLREFRR